MEKQIDILGFGRKQLNPETVIEITSILSKDNMLPCDKTRFACDETFGSFYMFGKQFKFYRASFVKGDRQQDLLIPCRSVIDTASVNKYLTLKFTK